MSGINRNFTEVLVNKYGLDISPFDESFVNKMILQRIYLTGCSDIKDYSRFVDENNTEATLVADLLQVSYSTFFRNMLTFSVLGNIVLPEILFRKRKGRSKEIRIWSAACSAGQEAYSMAILLEEHINSKKNEIRYRIFATDRNEKQIEQAQKGSYHPDHLANISLKYLEKWFVQENGYYAVKPKLKKHIDFSAFDLLSKHSSPPESIFGEFDLVFCANLLFYYKENYRKKIIDKLSSSLTDDGYLIVGETEREILNACKFEEVYPQSGIFRKK
jgi:chemotaxis methyl-accepting protein methylase